jgi:DNA polymerase III alpha subunit
MYFDSKHKRVLLRDGKSIVDPFEYARAIIESRREDNILVLASNDTDKYKFVRGVDISSDVEDVEPLPSHIEPDIDEIYTILAESERFTCTGKEVKRIRHELDYFYENNHIGFLLKLHDMIQKFKKDGVVWGVGRGSGSASYVLYLLEVHDIDPIKYNIDFSEMSKEVMEYD